MSRAQNTLKPCGEGRFIIMSPEGEEIGRIYPYLGGAEAHMIKPEAPVDEWETYPIIRGGWESIKAQLNIKHE